ncbi:Receptor protein kinase-like protein [Hibiscus syriacus]|uniref:Receptor protein kinase-like protein n=1 Tax=Hibiscus syriacus TaxID=106335 RepID=A0A6A2ZKT4_HIBSY|nr:Receptor protein kinase-like protein [Hibiscus syriacus]
MAFNNCFTFLLLQFLLLLLVPSIALNNDGVLLLSFKYSILSDPLSVLQSWNYDDETPCTWAGVNCTEIGIPGTSDAFRVTSLILPNSQLLGSISEDIGFIQHLSHLDLSSNFFNGTLPSSIFNSTELQLLSLSDNVISGELPEAIGGMVGLQILNLSDNALAEKVPHNLTALQNLTAVSLRGNYFSGDVPSGFDSVDLLDLSSNLLNGTLPLDFGGGNLGLLNLSYNKISGSISPEFAKQIPRKATIDLSFNNLTGAIPDSQPLVNQKTESFSGNVDLSIAVIPKSIDSTPVASSTPGEPNNVQNQAKASLNPGTIAAIVVADLAGVSIIGMVVLYVYQLRKGKALTQRTDATSNLEKKPNVPLSTVMSSSCSCIKIKFMESLETTSSDSEMEEKNQVLNVSRAEAYRKGGKLMTLNEGTELLELETLLKSSAYILGTSGSSIVYKAVLDNGTAFAVRRIGDSTIERLKDFETHVRNIAKLKHPNLVKLLGFYWGNDEKLVIYEYISYGSLGCSSYRRSGSSSSPCHFTLDDRLKIARAVARGLVYIHEKKQVHGNIKPSNILLNSSMEPLISDLGLHRVVSARFVSSQPSTSSSSTPYQAPESIKNLKPNPKWDVYSFGIVLFELLSGRVFTAGELGQWEVPADSVGEEKNRAVRLADVAIRGDMEGREEAALACFRLGFSCASYVPQKRPSMKEAVRVSDSSSC